MRRDDRRSGVATRTDDEIRTDVGAALIADSWIDSTYIDVSVDGGLVTLSGTADSVLEKRDRFSATCGGSFP